MKLEIKIPSVGESVQEALLAEWYRRDGDMVKKDEVLFVIETDKVTLEVSAEADGALRILVPAGETVRVGAVVGTLDTEAAPSREEREPPPGMEGRPEAAPTAPEEPVKPLRTDARKPTPEPTQPERQGPGSLPEQAPAPEAARERGAEREEMLSPSVRRMVAERGLDISGIPGTGPGGRITKGDVLLHMEESTQPPPPPHPELRRTEERRPERPAVEPAEKRDAAAPPREQTTRKPMSRIRQRIAERLLEARNNTAMLTTFNEVDMSRVQAIRASFKEAFRAKHGVSLGIMSFFIKASVTALQEFPQVNAFIDGKDILYHNYYHIGVAVGAERGLVVPVIRHADRLSFAEIEQAIVEYVNKIRDNKLELSDLEGGTFTLTNGGVFGSLLSTPILNPPQSGILGMHKTEDRPVVVNSQIVIRPMMYVAFSYDHRIIDGREAVTFLKRIKECLENPERIMLEM
jgi:2-oxoglutarate dehydrogenase E2 component (dihydrolipoamide succinyltransferase)